MTYTFKKFEQVQIHQMYMIISFIEIYETLLFFNSVANTILTYMTYKFDSGSKRYEYQRRSEVCN